MEGALARTCTILVALVVTPALSSSICLVKEQRQRPSSLEEPRSVVDVSANLDRFLERRPVLRLRRRSKVDCLCPLCPCPEP